MCCLNLLQTLQNLKTAKADDKSEGASVGAVPGASPLAAGVRRTDISGVVARGYVLTYLCVLPGTENRLSASIPRLLSAALVVVVPVCSAVPLVGPKR